jgi:hypothetical protein
VKQLGTEESEEDQVVYCSAFLNGIPNEIAYGHNNHSKPFKGQKNKVVFEPKATEKSGKHIATLHKKQIINKLGYKQTVYVKWGQEGHKWTPVSTKLEGDDVWDADLKNNTTQAQAKKDLDEIIEFQGKLNEGIPEPEHYKEDPNVLVEKFKENISVYNEKTNLRNARVSQIMNSFEPIDISNMGFMELLSYRDVLSDAEDTLRHKGFYQRARIDANNARIIAIVNELRAVSEKIESTIIDWHENDKDSFITAAYMSHRDLMGLGQSVFNNFILTTKEQEVKDDLHLVGKLFDNEPWALSHEDLDGIKEEAFSPKYVNDMFVNAWKENSRRPICQFAQVTVAKELGVDESLYFPHYMIYNNQSFKDMLKYISGTQIEKTMKDVVLQSYHKTQEELKSWDGINKIAYEEAKNKLSDWDHDFNLKHSGWSEYLKMTDDMRALEKERRDFLDSEKNKVYSPYYPHHGEVKAFTTDGYEEYKQTVRGMNAKLADIVDSRQQVYANIRSETGGQEFDDFIHIRTTIENQIEKYNDAKNLFNGSFITVDGKKYIRLFRGVEGEYNVHSVLESWTIERAVAGGFDGANILSKYVPIEMIYNFYGSSTWRQRPGGMGEYEYEFIVINGGEGKDNPSIDPKSYDAKVLRGKMDALGKSYSHKYVKRTGAPGNYEYFYDEPQEDRKPAGLIDQATYEDVHAQMQTDLKDISTDKVDYEEIHGAIGENIDHIVGNSKKELKKYSSYLAADTALRARDFIDHMRSIITDIDLDSKMVNRMMKDSIRKLVYQEVESNRQQFTDHGIRHVVGDIIRQDAIMKEATKGSYTPMDRFMAAFALINHDIGYTHPAIRAGGAEGVKASHGHEKYSAKILEEQKGIWNEDRIFSAEEYAKIVDVVAHHDTTDIDLGNLLKTTCALSDNLSLFNEEKLPSMFKYVEHGRDLLIAIQHASGDKEKLSLAKVALGRAIDSSDINSNLKRDLKAAVKQISENTPRFTVGVLAGEIGNIYTDKVGKINIDIHHNKWDEFLQKTFDMGQRQVIKLLKDYGHTDFTKTEYDLGNFFTIRLIGYKGGDNEKKN